MPDVITEFRGKYEFLSNFYQQTVPFKYEDVLFYYVEYFFQWSKTTDPGWRGKIIKATTPGRAKRLGRQCPMRDDWVLIRPDVMELGQWLKYTVSETMTRMLLDTGKAELIEGNTWHDNLWGDCMCPKCKDIPGHNLLGLAIMRTRDKLGARMERRVDIEVMYYLDTGYGCGAVVAQDGKITDTAPIFKWMRGKTLEKTIEYLNNKNQLKQFKPLKI